MRWKMLGKMGCDQLMVYALDSPIGKIKMETCSKGLHFLSQSAYDDSDFTPDLSFPVSLKTDNTTKIFNDSISDKNASACIEWLSLFFTDPSLCKNAPKPKFCFLQAAGSGSFRERVWWTLAEKVGPGETISYGDLAALSGSKGAAQAAGSAMASNPIQLIVPCHRVTRSDGAVGNYAFGRKNKVKLWLLNHEGVAVDNKGFLKRKA